MESDNDDFESADEEPALHDASERKNVEEGTKTRVVILQNKGETVKESTTAERASQNKNDGWDNDWEEFDVDESLRLQENVDLNTSQRVKNADVIIPQKNVNVSQKDTDGWNEFDDWENNDVNIVDSDKSESELKMQEHSEREYKDLVDRLSGLSGASGNISGNTWGSWGGWGVTNLLTTGVSQLTSHVSQGIASVSQVIESGIGVPDPSELAQSQNKITEFKEENKPSSTNESPKTDLPEKNVKSASDLSESNEEFGVFKLGKLMSSVTKLVETTGTAVVTGGLDTLEEIGKRTMRVLQGEEEGKKRLSTLLREARDRAEQIPQNISDIGNVKKKQPKFEVLFDDYQGLVHLEALEMLSKQCDMKIQSLLMSHEGQELIELKETLNQVKDICELTNLDDEEDSKDKADIITSEEFRDKLNQSFEDVGIKLQFDQIIKCWEDIMSKVKEEEEYINNLEVKDPSETIILTNVLNDKIENVTNQSLNSLAESCALSVQLLHRSTALFSVRERRSTADEADGLTQLTEVLISHVGRIETLYSQLFIKLSQKCNNLVNTNESITTVFLEAGKGKSYIHNAFSLTIPILQVGAV